MWTKQASIIFKALVGYHFWLLKFLLKHLHHLLEIVIFWLHVLYGCHVRTVLNLQGWKALLEPDVFINKSKLWFIDFLWLRVLVPFWDYPTSGFCQANINENFHWVFWHRHVSACSHKDQRKKYDEMAFNRIMSCDQNRWGIQREWMSCLLVYEWGDQNYSCMKTFMRWFNWKNYYQ